MLEFSIDYLGKPKVLERQSELFSFDISSEINILNHIVSDFELSVLMESFVSETLEFGDFSNGNRLVWKL